MSGIYKSVNKKLFKIGFCHISTFAIWMELTSIQVISRFEILMFFIGRFSDSQSSSNEVFTSSAFSFSLSSLDKMANIIIWQPFSLLVFAKSIILLAISNGSIVDLKSLVPICRVSLLSFLLLCGKDYKNCFKESKKFNGYANR